MRTISYFRWSVLALVLLSACQSIGGRDTIATLRSRHIEIKEEKIEGGLEKAMEGYRRFLEETPESALKPEAIRRLADLKIEKEYGYIAAGGGRAVRAASRPQAPAEVPRPVAVPPAVASGPTPSNRESDAEFEKRTVSSGPASPAAAKGSIALPGSEDLERAGAQEAIALYRKLLKQYPHYEHNDEVLYQMSRACEEQGQVEEAMQVMDRMVREYPHSRYIDEVQFRRAEYFFTRKRYLDAEDAYKSIVTMGASSLYYQLALYKLGWTFYKQELYDDALDRFIALLDYKVSTGYDFAQTADKAERKRMEDTFRVISLSFSNTGGSKSVVEYFTTHGKRGYEDRVYSNLGEFYFDKRRYADAAATYNAYVSRNPFERVSPQFAMRVIEIQLAGGFPSLVIDAKKQFAATYGLKAAYWRHFDPAARPEVLAWLKTNITDLAKHYHALYQSPEQAKEKKENFEEALHWYREFLASFPKDPSSPAVNYLLADLLMENHSYDLAAREYEKTAYAYPRHEKSSKAGYAAVYAWRQELAGAAAGEKDQVRREVVRSSLKFADTYPEHEKAAIVLGAAADDLYDLREYAQALATAQKLNTVFPNADKEVKRGAWDVIAHSSFDLQRYSDAEAAYVKLLGFVPEGDKERGALVDNLAVSIYKQGEEAKARKDYRAAADHFLRVGALAPGSKVRPDAEYDAAAALIQLKDWKAAAAVLTGFRDKFPGNKLQPKVTEKIAYVYKEDGRLTEAATEYERIERESRDEAVRREALLTAADLHAQAGDLERAIGVYRRYVEYFPHPAEPNLEARTKIAEALKKKDDQDAYLAELGQIVAIDAAAGGERTPRTRYLAGNAALVLAEQTFDQFAEVKLVKPFKANLRRKKELMEKATKKFSQLLQYEVGEVTAGATFYLAEIYANFSKALLNSERPEGLGPVEREQYDLAIEEQAYPFEDKAIAVHKKNLELITVGIYNEWVDKSLQKLAKFVPARYDKPEEESAVVTSPDSYVFAIDRPAVPAPQALAGAAAAAEPKAAEKPIENNGAVKADEPKQDAEHVTTKEQVQKARPKQDVKSGETNTAVKADEPKQDGERVTTKEQVQTVQSKQDVKSGESNTAVKAERPKQDAKRGKANKAVKADEPKQGVKKVVTIAPKPTPDKSIDQGASSDGVTKKN
jgi:tetratricopeptide (TPR) repeat protein